MDSIGFPLNLKLRIWIGYLISFAAWIAAQLFLHGFLILLTYGYELPRGLARGGYLVNRESCFP